MMRASATRLASEPWLDAGWCGDGDGDGDGDGNGSDGSSDGGSDGSRGPESCGALRWTNRRGCDGDGDGEDEDEDDGEDEDEKRAAGGRRGEIATF
jgi:hypothetical protein